MLSGMIELTGRPAVDTRGRESRAIPRRHTVYESAALEEERSCTRACERVAKIESFAHLHTLVTQRVEIGRKRRNGYGRWV